MDCRESLPPQETSISARRDAIVRQKMSQLLDWLEQHGRKATKRELQQVHVAGIRTARDADLLLDEFVREYPGTVRKERTGKRGPETVVVYAPERRSS
jgi:hypothetical protein